MPLTVSRLSILIALLCLATQPTVSQSQSVPPEISFQGLLTDNEGTAVTGTKSVLFSIYPDTITSTSQWSETQSVAFDNGLFSIYLGEVNPLADSVFTGLPVWLGIKIESDPEIHPRTKIVSVPYAFRTEEATCIGSVWYYDSDSDLFGSDSTGVACEQPLGFVSVGGDCVDSDETIFPGALELCDNVNNDCDGTTNDGEDEPWYNSECDGVDADLCPEGNLVCLSGIQFCTDLSPDTPEICSNGLDDDCDGDTDELDCQS